MLAGRSTEAHVHHSLTQLDITDSDDDRRRVLAYLNGTQPEPSAAITQTARCEPPPRL